MKKTSSIFVIIVAVGLLSCEKSSTQPVKPVTYSKNPKNIAITGGSVREASGIADSKANPGYIWVEADSGNPPDIYLLGHDGKMGRTIPIENAENRDWEDIALGAGPKDGVKYLYLADIGDNNLNNEEYLFYRFEEPLMDADRITGYNKILFKYPDGPHDAEAFLLDANTKDIYVITKRDDKSKVYKLSYPQDTLNLNYAVFVSDLAFNGVVSAAVSPDNREIIVKTYTTLYYYSREASETVAATLARTPSTLSYQLEAQGEAVSFALDNSGFYTLSETNSDIPATLNFYKRN